MNKKPMWIWYPGDFEIYHHLLLNTRREERNHYWPAFWRLDDCYHNVRFRKEVCCDAPEEMTVYARGIGHVMVDGHKHPFRQPIILSAGNHEIVISIARTDGLPCVYVDGERSVSDSSWEANDFSFEWLPAGSNGLYMNREDDPNIFAFQYKVLKPLSVEAGQDGILYDFGQETFAALSFKHIQAPNGIQLFYGESIDEALDTEHSILIDTVPAGSDTYRCPPRAFRYLFVQGVGTEQFMLTALYEFLPFDRRGSFTCSNEMINRIWDMAEYTFHLNSREFFLDGIKRDRWVWSGDAYQSYLINNYLYFDADITKRTIIALRGKDPIVKHINTILDYSFFWIMSIDAYYQATKDMDFITFIYPRMKSMMDYCISLADDDGFIRGREGDWVFIDWAEIDKIGAVSAEQILFAESLKATWACGELLGNGEERYIKRYDQLKEQIKASFWDEERGAYIDSFESGNRNITRHTNIFALLWGYADTEQRESIIANVLLNDAVPQISTPYFKFYELEVMCNIGRLGDVTDQIQDYWGGMLQLGATTFWEEYNPAVTDLERYGMYGDRYGKSLCHAWGASPIYLLGRYYLGVYSTSAGYDTFVVEPRLGGLEWMKGTVPVNGGTVSVELTQQSLEVVTDQSGGTVRILGREYPLMKDIPFIMNLM
ncbi:amylo-alpha-1,6-glucosidase [Paenibacillus sp. LHD-38]|uniref:alpha-L-rhamnosidase-related protein n=1 Tax=Paenibacillus sp. LHD-38 TaxID=3072143 RepID=UPI00280FEFDF|nr:amylo-alpha-1,6-glucosidase [Paenibacillus sp. LHD-38]MDQ8738131.1 amylo-alpha-1,6-glucosidase [Paenibacillus sp. LHD-38]